MNPSIRLFTSLLVSLFLLVDKAEAQVQWIANTSFTDVRYTSLYDMLQDGNPVIIAIGNVHSQSSEQLLASQTLQKLSAEHSDGQFGGRFSTKDLKVAFINVQVMEQEAAEQMPKGLQFIHFNEGDETFNSAGWDALYSITSTKLFLITPDHLVRPLVGKTADDIYTEVKYYHSKLKPGSTPDVRLLEASMSGSGKAALVRVQNFSSAPMDCIEVNVVKDGAVIARSFYHNKIASLEDAVISVPVAVAEGEKLSIVAKVEGDADQLNNRWAGALHSAVDASMIAGSFSK
jgi:hypothetical protein